MILLGLTGGIGMGKSTAASLLEHMGASVVDTDHLARAVVEPGQPAMKELREAFGMQIFAADGTLLRDEMARLVFSDESKLRKLESILHPRIRDMWRKQVVEWRAQNKPIGAVVIPLLFETGAEEEFDRVVCVACSRASQRERLKARGWSEEQIAQRIAAQ